MTERRKHDRKRDQEISLFIQNQNKLNQKIELALFGNENENGVVNDVKEMRAFFVPIGAAIGALYGIIRFFKGLPIQ